MIKFKWFGNLIGISLSWRRWWYGKKPMYSYCLGYYCGKSFDCTVLEWRGIDFYYHIVWYNGIA